MTFLRVAKALTVFGDKMVMTGFMEEKGKTLFMDKMGMTFLMEERGMTRFMEEKVMTFISLTILMIMSLNSPTRVLI